MNAVFSGPTEPSGTSFVYPSVWALPVAATTTGDILASVSGGGFTETWLILLSAEYVSGLASNALDKHANGGGLASTPDTGAAGPTTVANEYAEAAFLGSPSGGNAGTLGGGFTSGGQDVSGVLAGVTYTLIEAYKILSATGSVDATRSTVWTAWSACVGTFK
jgi:hypothetical protein